MKKCILKKAFKKVCATGIAVILLVFCFVFFSALFFYLSTLVNHNFSERGIRHGGRFLARVLQDPLFLQNAYAQWFEVLQKSFKTGVFKTAEFIPFFTPFFMLVILVVAFVKSRCSFGLWFRLNNRYAELKDVEQMGLLDGRFFALGNFESRLLGLKKCLSVLCLGDTGRGKTAGVAIPSILRSDQACVVAVDNSNELAKYTSGYRASLGPVFYFNWNLHDEPLKNEYYPRWNPLSEGNMPAKGEERDKYLAAIAKYFIVNTTEKDTDAYWQRLAAVSLEGLLNFFVCKIEQACANDYFLSEILDKGKLGRQDREILLSYYVLLPKEYAASAIQNLEAGKIDGSTYMPVGSWKGIPSAWQGKEICPAMFFDWLLESYLSVKKENQEADGWKVLIERWGEEAEFFAYGDKSMQTLQHLFYLSRKQRSIIFPMIFKPLSVFRNKSVRERTSSSDFHTGQLRGIKNSQTGKTEVVTLYNIAGRKSVEFIGRFFVDMLIESNLTASAKGAFPLMFVIDDFENQPYYSSLSAGLLYGEKADISFLLLSDSLTKMNEKYGQSGLEDIINSTVCKLVLADDSEKLGRQFESLAAFGTKSVQIPADGARGFMKVQQGLSDADYYKAIARNLYHEHKSKLVIGNQYLILSGYYHLPVRLQSMYFLQHEELKEKVTQGTSYFISEDMQSHRNMQDIDVPELMDVLSESGLEIDNEEDIHIFIDDKYEEAVEVRRVVTDQKSPLEDDIAARWNSRKENTAENGDADDSDWWMREGAFTFVRPAGDNPFGTKK